MSASVKPLTLNDVLSAAQEHHHYRCGADDGNLSERLVDGSKLAELEREQEAIDALGKGRLGNMILNMDKGNSSPKESYTVSDAPEDEDDNVKTVGKRSLQV
ncbi:hypothetical protein Pmar_PMAR008646 [Perkinsus marinus ATCC 50983]|uniref:Uncharacterized protein n=1 Tax=Perkinsus marinus (strain ATCC 50983 / TXsc) TaxID=423536 RepID=C5LQ88_PERM5|nr:hypothetical protein Pmar_PMAR008646 [Perkinsus marinus ATCC 50983]EER01097.1 hypothetical protein Pmar_PMAR008646 [Perkinsus marinus ATCC 50983]|eukprot:XP_002768379.1 hypothetical protein Pmar_PMAR008646 [Perkinsus marinus ATCC 50983]